MYISDFLISNYKSFADSGQVRLERGFNVIVGKNNVGKTALVEALGLQNGDHPHRSLDTVPTRSTEPDPASQTSISFVISKEELFSLLESLSTFYVPVLATGHVDEDVHDFLGAIEERNLIECVFHGNNLVSASLPSYRVQGSNSMRQFVMRSSNESPTLGPESGVFSRLNGPEPFMLPIARVLASRIYTFKAVRFNILSGSVAADPLLNPDASNLAQVLNLLQSRNPSLWQEYLSLVRTIFPEIRQITVPPDPSTGSSVHIMLWTVDPDVRRDDLAVPLSESGTGVGQVLAIIYVMLTSDYPATIIIDEPQSFLHPGAIRKLFDIIREHHRHQYIITTHSPIAVTAADPRTPLLIRKIEAKSIIETVNTDETKELRRFLSEVGARLSDVFGADSILWVEGPTEEECFPLIMSRLAKQPLFGTEIVGVVETGAFEAKRSKSIVEIYKRLSEGRGLLPPAVGFIFDQEDRTEKQREDLIRDSNGTVSFTPRRMYENYLLNSLAIASIASSIEGFRHSADITPNEVEEWLERNRWNSKYFGRRQVTEASRNEDTWLRAVHGAKLLQDMFNELSETRVAYDKVEHGYALTEWLVDNAPSDLDEIAGLLKEKLARR